MKNPNTNPHGWREVESSKKVRNKKVTSKSLPAPSSAQELFMLPEQDEPALRVV
jgi:hypothetical protein